MHILIPVFNIDVVFIVFLIKSRRFKCKTIFSLRIHGVLVEDEQDLKLCEKNSVLCTYNYFFRKHVYRVRTKTIGSWCFVFMMRIFVMKCFVSYCIMIPWSTRG